MPSKRMPSNAELVWALARRIPPGRVMTYGQIADVLADECGAVMTARAVGRAMGEVPDDVPWHRVVNSQGRSSVDRDGRRRQQSLLEEEGVRFTRDRLRLNEYRWFPGKT
ncbi:MAG: MGMT family protein [Myxococcota bacterium]